MPSEESLGAFSSETAMAAPRANLRAVSLDDVLVRETPVHWDEAVAVVQELCDLLTAAGGDEPLVPELAGILITADGKVKVQRGGRGEPGATGAGRTLHALLASANVPVAFRLFVTQSISAERYSSIGGFAEALAYFGKPGRAELIRALYERCAAKGASTSAVTSTRPPDPATKPERKSASRRMPRIPAWSAAAAVAVCILGGGLWFWSGTASATSSVSSVPAFISEAKIAIQSLATEVRSTMGVGGAPASVTSEQTTVRPAAPVRNGTVRRNSIPVGPRTTDDKQMMVAPLGGIQPQSPHVEPAAHVSPPMGNPLSIGASASGDVVVQVIEVQGENLQTVYSNADLDVQPPVLMYPQLPAPIMTGHHSDATNTMELIVSANGNVERVRLIDGPRRMPDMMLLSGAKMWRFEPAVRNGTRVRYRTTVAWIGGP
jgi:hypothetical protein